MIRGNYKRNNIISRLDQILNIIKLQKKKNIVKKRRLMTLVELLVVLSIMAAIATIALTGGNEMMEQANTNETTRRGNLVSKSLNSDGVNISRFISDMGRLPIILNNIHSLNLAELFYSPENISYSVKWSNKERFNNNIDNFPEAWDTLKFNVTLPCGWRGPYLHLNKKKFYDGFGNEWDVTHSNWSIDSKVWTSGDVGSKIYGIRSLGRGYTVDTGGEEWYEEDRKFYFLENLITANLTVMIMGRDCSCSPNVFRKIEAISKWEFTTVYSVGNIIHSKSGAELFECTMAGTSGNIEPNWNGAIGNITNDKDIIWECVSSTNRHYDMDKIRVAVFLPYVTTTFRKVKRVLAKNGEGAGEDLERSPNIDAGEKQWWTGFHEVRITNLPPGLRKIYVYGFRNNGSTNKYGSGIISVELKPGENHITVFLTEDLN